MIGLCMVLKRARRRGRFTGTTSRQIKPSYGRMYVVCHKQIIVSLRLCHYQAYRSFGPVQVKPVLENIKHVTVSAARLACRVQMIFHLHLTSLSSFFPSSRH